MEKKTGFEDQQECSLNKKLLVKLKTGFVFKTFIVLPKFDKLAWVQLNLDRIFVGLENNKMDPRERLVDT